MTETDEEVPDPPRPGRAKKALFSLVVITLVFGLAELLVRLLTGAPTGEFAFLMPSHDQGIYPASTTITNTWGPIQYSVRTNSIGLRGEEIAFDKPAGTIRIACVGDSVTDGFFIDNEATYPHQLQLLFADHEPPVEVCSAARGGGSIAKEIAITEQVALPLQPDLVLLTFVTNDIADLRKVPPDALLSSGTGFKRGAGSVNDRVFTWLVNHSGLVESVYGFFYDRTYKREMRPTGARDDARYQIPGGDDFAGNTKAFMDRYAKTDAIVLRDRLSKEAEGLVAAYLRGFERFVELCRERGGTPVLVYFPAYPEVYGTDPPMRMRDRLARAATDRKVPFCDLTALFRSKGKDKVLHMAPIDYHPNPAGNALVARGIHAFLVDRKLVRPR